MNKQTIIKIVLSAAVTAIVNKAVGRSINNGVDRLFGKA